MTALANLRACPFCGGSNLVISRMHGTGDRYVVCQTPECKTCGPSGDDQEDAAAAWNARALSLPEPGEAVGKVIARRENGHMQFSFHPNASAYDVANAQPDARPLDAMQKEPFSVYTHPAAPAGVSEEMVDSVRADIMQAAANDGHADVVLKDEWVRTALMAALQEPRKP